jgi:hypothetical protein
MTARLSDGFEIKISESVTDDWEFLEVLAGIDEGETGLIVKAAKMLLGSEGVKMLKDHLRDARSGKVSSTAMVTALGELMESVNSLKN